uniref:Uncharacterized protein n=1 Tax=Leptocylindrus danicus TaxID=163516 RepID=A0A7S2LQ49_9STRA|mmetsp:Transcript_8543/g.12680  ORF Transcript_8543/g.12680 Transcript_8543/m.12680 type:complete len:567 (+) Transcript_8543:398-2098(+)
MHRSNSVKLNEWTADPNYCSEKSTTSTPVHENPNSAIAVEGNIKHPTMMSRSQSFCDGMLTPKRSIFPTTTIDRYKPYVASGNMNRSMSLPSRLCSPPQHASLAQDSSNLTRIDPHAQFDMAKHLPFLSLEDDSAEEVLPSPDLVVAGGEEVEDTSVPRPQQQQQVDDQAQAEKLQRSIFGGGLKMRKSSTDGTSSFMTASTSVSDASLSSEGSEVATVAPRPKSILRNKSLDSSFEGNAQRRRVSRMSERCKSFDDELYSRERKLGFPQHNDRRTKSCSQMMKVSFASRVRVLEFERSKDEDSHGFAGWFTPLELAKFKADAVRQMREERARLFIGGRTRSMRGSEAFATPIMPVVTPSGSPRIKPSITTEIQNILVVDVHDIFLKLFSKALKEMMPHVKVVTAMSAIEALKQIEIAKLAHGNRLDAPTHGFDIVIAEERLHSPNMSTRNNMARKYSGSKEVHSTSPASVDGLFLDNKQDPSESISYTGSQLIGFLNQQEKVAESRGMFAVQRTFLIGVSASLKDDRTKLSKAGANLLWSKPPPLMNNALRDTLFNGVLEKRGKK